MTIQRIRVPVDPSEEQLAAAYEAGLLKRDSLVHGTYYEGYCRNATVARWHSRLQTFVHWREKFGSLFLETIRHPEDENRYDVFVAQQVLERLEVPNSSHIPDKDFEGF